MADPSALTRSWQRVACCKTHGLEVACPEPTTDNGQIGSDRSIPRRFSESLLFGLIMGTRDFENKLNPKRLFELVFTCNFLDCNKGLPLYAGALEIARSIRSKANQLQRVERWKYSFFPARVAQNTRNRPLRIPASNLQ